jgi:hypothetical protein
MLRLGLVMMKRTSRRFSEWIGSRVGTICETNKGRVGEVTHIERLERTPYLATSWR